MMSIPGMSSCHSAVVLTYIINEQDVIINAPLLILTPPVTWQRLAAE